MQLFDRVREFLHGRAPLAKDRRGGAADLELRAATAVLLLEAAYGDGDYAWSEHRTILRGLERAFGIDGRQARELLGRAEEIRPPAVHLDDVTEVLKARLDEGQRRAVLDLVWQVIDADDVRETWEESFAAHVARAVGLPSDTPRPGVGAA